jgi:hypothetical protein
MDARKRGKRRMLINVWQSDSGKELEMDAVRRRKGG